MNSLKLLDARIAQELVENHGHHFVKVNRSIVSDRYYDAQEKLNDAFSCKKAVFACLATDVK